MQIYFLALVNHDFSSITLDLAGFAGAILAAIVAVILVGLVAYGVALAWDAFSRMFKLGIYDPNDIDNYDQ